MHRSKDVEQACHRHGLDVCRRQTYERSFSPEAVFDLQDDLVPRVVSTCADHFGVLARAISEAVRGKPAGQLTAREAALRAAVLPNPKQLSATQPSDYVRSRAARIESA